MQFGEKSLLSPSTKIIFTMSLPIWRFRSTCKWMRTNHVFRKKKNYSLKTEANRKKKNHLNECVIKMSCKRMKRVIYVSHKLWVGAKMSVNLVALYNFAQIKYMRHDDKGIYQAKSLCSIKMFAFFFLGQPLASHQKYSTTKNTFMKPSVICVFHFT